MMGFINTFDMYAEDLKRDKTIHVYLPSDYHHTERTYPVLYMHDGQNLFYEYLSTYGSIWDVHHAMDDITDSMKRSMIVVGIDVESEHRLDEYSPWKGRPDERIPEGDQRLSRGGEADCYLKWIVDTLKPMIDATYHTNRTVSYMAGSSMGGLISLYAAYRFYPVFKGVGIFSPAFWFAPDELMSFIYHNIKAGVRVYMDMGHKETSHQNLDEFPTIYLDHVRKVRDVLKDHDIHDLRYVEDEKGIHHETAWKRRFPDFVKWLMIDQSQDYD